MTPIRKRSRSFIIVVIFLALIGILEMLVLFGNPRCRTAFRVLIHRLPAFYNMNPPPGYTGKWVTWYADGRIRSEGQCVNGEMNGSYISWDEKGRIDFVRYGDKFQSSCVYWRDKADGNLGLSAVFTDRSQIFFYSNGQIETLNEVQNGRLNGKVMKWTRDGSLISDAGYRDGEEVIDPSRLVTNAVSPVTCVPSTIIAYVTATNLNMSGVQKLIGLPQAECREANGWSRWIYQYEDGNRNIGKCIVIFDPDGDLYSIALPAGEQYGIKYKQRCEEW